MSNLGLDDGLIVKSTNKKLNTNMAILWSAGSEVCRDKSDITEPTITTGMTDQAEIEPNQITHSFYEQRIQFGYNSVQ